MKLNNRAFNYEPNLSNIELTESGIVDNQGTDWKQKYPRHIPVPQVKIDLKSPAVECSTGDLIYIEANKASTDKRIPPSTQFDGCARRLLVISDFRVEGRIAGPV